MSKLVVVKDTDEAQKLEATSDAPEIGSWWWVNESSSDDCDKPGAWLACVIEIGSNYAKIQGVRFHNRIALDDFHDLCTAEPNPEAFIAQKLGEHKGNVRELMGQIQQLCHQLGVPYRQALAEAEQVSTALASAHSIDNVKTYSKALQKAKDKTLPDLFKQVREQHELMATWMKADLIPLNADLNQAKDITKVIEQKIHTVELYAGLQEELIQVREGEPAPLDTQVHLMQRRHYMDEECLIRYEAGGMDFKNIKSFDKWLSRTENFVRLLPHDRCIVAFRIRRFDKGYGVGDSLSRFIRFLNFNRYNKSTFLYIRNRVEALGRPARSSGRKTRNPILIPTPTTPTRTKLMKPTKTEDEIKAMFGDWQAKAAAIPTLPPSVLIGCLANGEHLAVLLGLQDLFAEPQTLQSLSPPEQATFVKHMQQIMEYTLEQVRAEIDKRFSKVDTKKP